MTQPNTPFSDLREIRDLMDRSRHFIGLSGLSGIGAGAVALLGVWLIGEYAAAAGFGPLSLHRLPGVAHPWGIDFPTFVLLVGGLVLTGALACGYFFTSRRALRQGQPIRDKRTRRLLFHLSVPLAVGGVLCIALFLRGYTVLIPAVMLIFYGLALLNAGHYAKEAVSALGYLEIALGLIACFFPGYGLLFWALGFGVLHLVYGTWMYRKYDRW